MTDIRGERVKLAAQGLAVRHREKWGAVYDYTTDKTVEMPARWFIFHIAVVTPTTMDATQRTIEKIGIQRFPNTGFSYNASVWSDGTLLEGQPLTRRGAHTVNDKRVPGFPMPPLTMNPAGRALVLPQNLQHAVTDAQIDSAARWAAAQIRAGLARTDAKWFGHRDFAAKDCPGGKGYDRLDELNELTRHYAANGLGDDMPLTDDDIRRVWEYTRGNQEQFNTHQMVKAASDPNHLLSHPVSAFDDRHVHTVLRQAADDASAALQAVREVKANQEEILAALEELRKGPPPAE